MQFYINNHYTKLFCEYFNLDGVYSRPTRKSKRLICKKGSRSGKHGVLRIFNTMSHDIMAQSAIIDTYTTITAPVDKKCDILVFYIFA